jgi:hypothetical protein
MATSGTTTFNLQKSDILNLAMQRINNLGLGQVLASDDSTLLSNTLNLMIKSWQPSLFPWTLTRGYLFLDRGQTEYHIDGTLAHATKTAHITTLSAAAGAGASAINVTSGTGFAIGYYVGVVQDTGYVAWTTASGVSGTSIALTAPTSTAAASGNRVYVYQTKISNILDITGVERVDTNSFSMPLEEMGRDAYFGASNNAQEVTAINNYYVDKQLGDVVAVWTSDSVAREPDESPAPVRVRVPFAHTSEARVPNVVSERVPAAHTAVGTFVIDEASTVRVEPSEVDAVRIWRLVFVFIFDASDVDAARTVEFVFELTAVWLALIAELREDDAVCTSESVASEPEVRPAPVSVRVP